MPDHLRPSPGNFIRRARQKIGRPAEEPVADHAFEPCMGCGESTATGTVFYSDRHVVRNSEGATAYLCSLCDARLRSSRKGERLTDEEVRDTVENGSAAAYPWGGGGPVTP